MTRRVSVDLPDDVADRLEAEPDTSGFVTEVVRHRITRESGDAMLAAQGFVITPEGRERARHRLNEARARMTPEKWAELRRVGREPAA